MTPAEQADYLIAHYATMTLRSIAAHLGLRYACVQARSYRLIAKGQLDPTTRFYGRPWNDDEREYLAEHWGKLPDASVAAHLNRTKDACEVEAKRDGLSRRSNVWSASDVARLFGVDRKTVTTWFARGWLKAKRAGFVQGGHRVWNVDEKSLERFVRTMGWAYDWHRMAEGEYLTNLARETAKRDPWLRLEEAAALLGWSKGPLDRWRKRGLLPWKYRPKASQQGPREGYVVIRRSDLEVFRATYADVTHRNRSAAAKRRVARDGGVGRRVAA